MGRYTGPKGRINRRLGEQVFESSGAIRALDKRESPPGMHQRRRKASNYGIALQEKQKIKYYYGLRERQLRRYFEKARRAGGNTGEQLLVLCEQRLDNVVRRAGLALSRPQARQGIVHAHFQLNGRTVTKPSIRVRPGDVITLRNRPNLKRIYRDIVDGGSTEPCPWIDTDAAEIKATVKTIPSFDEVSLHVEVGLVVAFMSR